jgi:hypothetical protein
VAAVTALDAGAFRPMPKLRVIDRNRDFVHQSAGKVASPGPPQSARKTKETANRGLGDDFLKEYYDKDADGHAPPLPHEPSEFDTLTFETQEIQETVDFIEFKMSEINALIKECIDRHFVYDPMADLNDVKHDCAGNSYQILTMSYQEGMRRVKDVLVELIKLKLPQISDNMNEEVDFFVDLIEQLVDSDFRIEETLHVAKRASKYYVSPRLFDRIIYNAQAEIMAFAAIQGRLRGARNDVMKTLEGYQIEEEESVRKLEQVSNGQTHRWHKDHVFTHLSQPAEFVGNYIHRPSSPQAKRIQGSVDAFLRSKKGSHMLGELATQNRAH